jgi:hypothetical protein
MARLREQLHDSRRHPHYGLGAEGARRLVEALEALGYADIRGGNPRTHFYLGPRVFRALALSHGHRPDLPRGEFLRLHPGPPAAGPHRARAPGLNGEEISDRRPEVFAADGRMRARLRVAEIVEQWEPGERLSPTDYRALQTAMAAGYGFPGTGTENERQLIETAVTMLYGDRQTRIGVNGHQMLLRDHFIDTIVGLRAQLGLDRRDHAVPRDVETADQLEARVELARMLQRWALRGSGVQGYGPLGPKRKAAELRRFGELLRRTGYGVTYEPDAHNDPALHLAHVTRAVTRLMANDRSAFTFFAGGRTHRLNGFFGGYLAEVRQAAERHIEEHTGNPTRSDAHGGREVTLRY